MVLKLEHEPTELTVTEVWGPSLEFLIHEVWGGAQVSAFRTSSQVMLMLLPWGSHLGELPLGGTVNFFCSTFRGLSLT